MTDHIPYASFVDCTHCGMDLWEHVAPTKKCPFVSTTFEPVVMTATDHRVFERNRQGDDSLIAVLRMVGKKVLRAYEKQESAWYAYYRRQQSNVRTPIETGDTGPYT